MARIEWTKADKRLHTALQVDYGMQKAFCDCFGFDQMAWYCNPLSLKKFLECNRGYNSGWHRQFDYLEEPWDHPEMFRNKTQDHRVLVGHNYLNEEESRDEVAKVIEPLGLRAVIFAKTDSWYCPNRTSLVVVMSQATFEHYQDRFSEYGTVHSII